MAFDQTKTLQLAYLRQIEQVGDGVASKGFITQLYGENAVGWDFPPYQWVKGNIDGSVRRELGEGIFRNDFGQWVGGFSSNIGSSSVLMAELWGIFTDLQLAWDMKFTKFWVESDSEVAVRLVVKGCIPCHPYAPMIMAIQELMSRDWVVRGEKGIGWRILLLIMATHCLWFSITSICHRQDVEI